MVISAFMNSEYVGSDTDAAEDAFAVVELFTSEGCSSCPPADRLLGDFVDDARNNDKRIFALAFHVDYWNYLGWEDIYASSEFSDRQRTYAEALKTNRIYTPQMIVNGNDEFVGSNRNRAKKSIRSALKKAAGIRITLQADIMSERDLIGVQF